MAIINSQNYASLNPTFGVNDFGAGSIITQNNSNNNITASGLEAEPISASHNHDEGCACSHCAAADNGGGFSGNNNANQNTGSGPATAYVYDESTVSNDLLQGLIVNRAWDNSTSITYHLAFSDHDGNTINDWDEDGAGTAMRAAFQAWGDIADIDFVEVLDPNDANLIEHINDAGGGNTLGNHFYPDPNDHVSEGNYNHDSSQWTASSLMQGGAAFVTLIHEIGHGLGLEHPHSRDLFNGVISSDSQLPGEFDLNQGIYTTMAYPDGWYTGIQATDNDSGYQGTPMALDIAAIQEMYGANMNHNTGNDTYVMPESNGSGTFFQGIWDAGGIDEITYGGTADSFIFLGEATIDYSPTGGGLISYAEGIVGGYTIARDAEIENASSGSGNDLVDGNDLNNNLVGNDGDDVLVGRLGVDTLNGGAGNDVLIGDFDGLSYLQEIDPTIGGGITLGSGTVTADATSNNQFTNTAIDLSNEFSLASSIFIEDSTTIPHVTVMGTGHDEIDIYAVTLNNPYATITIDMDLTSAGFDSRIGVYTSSGSFIRRNEDNLAALGGFGSPDDHGNGYSTDSHMTFTPYEAGTYLIVVSHIEGLDPIPAGETYQMHVSVENELGGASPYAHVLDYFDFTATGGVADNLIGGDGDDKLFGGAGNDNLNGGAGADEIDGGLGADTLTYADSAAGVIVNLASGTASGGDAAGDTITGVENIIGTSVKDVIVGTNKANSIYGGDGSDVLSGRGGNDRLFGEAGNDVLRPGTGADEVQGGTGFDSVDYRQSTAAISIDLSTNTHSGGDAAGDTIFDVQRVYATAHDDTIIGDDQDNILLGVAGNDTLNGGIGTDKLIGQAGNDTFVHAATYDLDVIVDFTQGDDVIDLSAYGFNDVSEVLALASQTNANVYINFGSGDALRILNATLGDFDASDFVL